MLRRTSAHDAVRCMLVSMMSANSSMSTNILVIFRVVCHVVVRQECHRGDDVTPDEAAPKRIGD